MRYRVFYADRFPRTFMAPAPTKVNLGEGFTEVTTVETDTLETLFREMNVVDGTELPIKLRVRSMSVGDVAVEEGSGRAHYCASVGWSEVATEGVAS